jgi:hypothetical protein
VKIVNLSGSEQKTEGMKVSNNYLTSFVFSFRKLTEQIFLRLFLTRDAISIKITIIHYLIVFVRVQSIERKHFRRRHHWRTVLQCCGIS